MGFEIIDVSGANATPLLDWSAGAKGQAAGSRFCLYWEEPERGVRSCPYLRCVLSKRRQESAQIAQDLVEQLLATDRCPTPASMPR